MSQFPPLDSDVERLQAPGEQQHFAPEPTMPSASILRRRHQAARALSRRQWLSDALLALTIVLVALIAGAGVGMLGVIAVLVLAGFGLLLAVGWLRRRRRVAAQAAISARRQRTR